MVPCFVSSVREFFSSSVFHKGCNSYSIHLIPKVIDAKYVTKSHHISLIGCQDKIVAKILVNRLSVVVGEQISVKRLALFLIVKN